MSRIPKISIIIPFYNGFNFFSHLIQSIKASLLEVSELGFVCEIITVIDSVETDQKEVQKMLFELFSCLGNVDIVLKKNIVNLGVARSRNVAIEVAKGEFLHIIDQDDLVSVEFYPEVVALIKTYNFILCNGLVRYLSKVVNSHKLYYFRPSITIVGLLKDDFIRSPGQVVFSRALCKTVRFPEPSSFKGADDRFFWIRLMTENEKTINPYYLSQPYYIANIHESNYSTDAVNLKRSALEGWDIIRWDENIKPYQRLIDIDRNRLKYALGDDQSFTEKISGCWTNFKYFATPNKLLRFIIKRKKW